MVASASGSVRRSLTIGVTLSIPSATARACSRSSIRGAMSTAITSATRGASASVISPVPAPRSSTRSLGAGAARSQTRSRRERNASELATASQASTRSSQPYGSSVRVAGSRRCRNVITDEAVRRQRISSCCCRFLFLRGNAVSSCRVPHPLRLPTPDHQNQHRTICPYSSPRAGRIMPSSRCCRRSSCSSAARRR
jgi:hypothetical protein